MIGDTPPLSLSLQAGGVAISSLAFWMTSVIIFIIFINLTPCVPLSLKGEGDEYVLKGFHPFKPPSFTVMANPISLSLRAEGVAISAVGYFWRLLRG